MSRTVNEITLIGNCGSDPEIRATASGSRVAKLSLATSRYIGKGEAREEKTEWHRLVVFGTTVDFVENYVRKGDKLYVRGRVEYSTVESDQGTKYFTDVAVHELILLTSKEDKGALRAKARVGGSGADDEIPFAPAE